MAKILSIIRGENNKILRSKSKKIKAEKLKTAETRELIEDMKLTMKDARGIGLAAPQIGKNIRLFTIETDEGSRVFVNPAIIWKSLNKEEDEEGCLSLPGVWGNVKRPKSVIVKFLDENGNKNILKARGLLSRVIQHENDHLNGILFTDKAKNIRRNV